MGPTGGRRREQCLLRPQHGRHLDHGDARDRGDTHDPAAGNYVITATLNMGEHEGLPPDTYTDTCELLVGSTFAADAFPVITGTMVGPGTPDKRRACRPCRPTRDRDGERRVQRRRRLRLRAQDHRD